MSFLNEWWNRIIQSVVWRSFFSELVWIDWVALVFLTVGLIYGLKKGFWKALADNIRMILVIVLTLEFDDYVNEFSGKYLSFIPSTAVPVIGFILTTFAAWLIVSFVIRIFRKMVSSAASSAIRTLGGTVFGPLYLFLMLSFLSQLVLLVPGEKLKQVYQPNGSKVGVYLAQTAPKIHERVAGFSKKVIASIRN
jgi:uncharacterized membrane protein required for colicin V production